MAQRIGEGIAKGSVHALTVYTKRKEVTWLYVSLVMTSMLLLGTWSA